jgi:hypothetical protein
MLRIQLPRVTLLPKPVLVEYIVQGQSQAGAADRKPILEFVFFICLMVVGCP